MAFSPSAADAPLPSMEGRISSKLINLTNAMRCPSQTAHAIAGAPYRKCAWCGQPQFGPMRFVPRHNSCASITNWISRCRSERPPIRLLAFLELLFRTTWRFSLSAPLASFRHQSFSRRHTDVGQDLQSFQFSRPTLHCAVALRPISPNYSHAVCSHAL